MQTTSRADEVYLHPGANEDEDLDTERHSEEEGEPVVAIEHT